MNQKCMFCDHECEPGGMFRHMVTAHSVVRADYPQDAERKARRERIATNAMLGLLASPNPAANMTASEVAEVAIKIADELIAELDKGAK